LEERLVAVSEKIKSLVGFLTQGFEQRDDLFEDMADEMEMDYPVQDNLALAPSYSNYSEKNERNDLKVVAHPNFRGHEVMVIEPRSFGEAGQIVQNLKERRTIVLNLHLLDKEQSQRTIDFVCGAAHALNGKPQKVGDMVFVFTPSNVTLSVDSTSNNNKFRDSLWNQPQQV
jgi:cell division inhibitor SepF